MDRETYLQEVWARLSNRMPRKDLEGVMRYYEEYFDEAGPAREAEVMAELGTPEELAARILEDRTAKGRRRGGIAVAAVLAALLVGGAVAAWMYAPAVRHRTFTATDVAYVAEAAPYVVPGRGLAPFTGLEVDASCGGVYVLGGEDYGVEVDGGGSWELTDGGTLVVRSDDPEFSGDARVTVYVPYGTRLESVDIDADLGECYLENFQTGRLTVDADCGSVTVTDVTASTATVTADLGSVALNGMAAEDLSVTLSAGELTGWGVTVERRLEVSSAMGSVELSGDLRGESTVKCDMGSISLLCDGAEEEYGYDLHTGLGAVRVNGYGGGSSAKRQGGPNTITATGSVGEITVEFG